MPRSWRLTRRGSGREGRRQRGGEVLGERSDGTNGGMERRKRWEKNMKTWRFNQAKWHFGVGFHHDKGKTPCKYRDIMELLISFLWHSAPKRETSGHEACCASRWVGST